MILLADQIKHYRESRQLWEKEKERLDESHQVLTRTCQDLMYTIASQKYGVSRKRLILNVSLISVPTVFLKKSTEAVPSPYLSIRGLTAADPDQGGYLSHKYLILVKNQWVLSSNLICNVPLHQVSFAPTPIVLEPSDVKAMCADYERLSGMKAFLQECQLMLPSGSPVPSTPEEAVALHEGSKAFASGVILGRDGEEDPWVVVRTKKNHLVIYYSTNGRGLGYNKCISPDKDCGDFLSRINDPTTRVKLEKDLAKRC